MGKGSSSPRPAGGKGVSHVILGEELSRQRGQPVRSPEVEARLAHSRNRQQGEVVVQKSALRESRRR